MVREDTVRTRTMGMGRQQMDASFTGESAEVIL